MKMDTVVAGVDFGGSGMGGARWAARFLSPGRVRLVHALDLPKPPKLLGGLWGDAEQILVSARAGALERLEDFARQLEDDTGVAVDAQVRIGHSDEQIAEVASASSANLIVLGRESGRRGAWGALGSTAARVVHDARCPTLIAVGSMERAPARILAPIDESAVTAGVLSWAGELAERFDAGLTVLHVFEFPLEAHLRAITSSAHAPGRESEIESKARDWLTERIREAGLDTERVDVRAALGEPTFEILAAAERYGVELIVMGSRGAGAVGRTLIGSVADSVVRRARCPVMVIPQT